MRTVEGWRIRHGVDVPVLVGVAATVGALVGAGIAWVWDHLAHQYRGGLR